MSYGSYPAGDRYSTEGERQPAYNFDVAKNMSDSDKGSAVGSLAGVGIFFQQDSDTNEVFVKTIVKGGSADRSGVLRVGDVVVRVDHDDVEGQPLSTLRSRILGNQGSYVTLGFRRREGAETTYYDVPLMRGSPEYFESLRATQPLQDEIERLTRQNSHLKAQRAQDAAELNGYRTHMDEQRQEFDRKYLAMDEALVRKDDEIQELKRQVMQLSEHAREAAHFRSEHERLKTSMSDDSRRAEEREGLRLHYIEELKHKMEDERMRSEGEIRKAQQEAQAARRQTEEAQAREQRLAEELRSKGDLERARRAKEGESRNKFELERRKIQEALKLNQAIGEGLREVEPQLAHLHAELFARDTSGISISPSTSTSNFPPQDNNSSAPHPPQGYGGGHGSISTSHNEGDDDTFFMA
eukprot:CAMPEP_0180137808 /NCGR_PEP_ID=MMETSP0986-20121125/12469_1 /TAXON_ID=697907 /ORGANISM="non described non described, Strain CCMP2293" /LENGTH=410 /DNA_ID=CAMNT_0022079413 /DNA_START=56 /DNA_END=1288 /DNA_ORIENTATION=+